METRLKNIERAKQQVSMSWHFMQFLIFRFNSDGCRQSAAALTYMSLFAIVPMLTLMYSMFSLFPAFQNIGGQVEAWVFSKFLPSSGQEITRYLTEFSSQARKLSSAGALILVVTAYLMLANIEKTFNHIWGTTGGRRGLTGFLIYWAILSLGPLLLAVGMVMRTYLLSFQLIVDEVDTLGVAGLLFSWVPWLLTWFAFSLLYIAVPNCKVNTYYAILGGFVTTILFESAKSLFGLLVAYSSYSNVYGAFAAIPLFLVWIYLLWSIILVGAELVRSLETFRFAGRGKKLPDLDAVLIVLWQCWRRQQKGQSLSDQMIARIGLDSEHWRWLRNVLLEKRILDKTANGRYVLIRDLGEITLTDVTNWFGQHILSRPKDENDRLLLINPWYDEYATLMKSVRSEMDDRFSITIEALFRLAPLENETVIEGRSSSDDSCRGAALSSNKELPSK